jgi:cysteine synthase
MIDLKIQEDKLKRSVQRAKERQIIIPTFNQMVHPEQIPAKIKSKLKDVGLWEINPLNLFRITWKNEPKAKGGQFGGVNFWEIPNTITGVKARIFTLFGKWFPTGAHKVGASFGCLVPRLVSGQFDPSTQKAAWPSTGNFCRGGAYNSKLLGCESIAILPENMSKERFEWLRTVASEVIATHGCESNVKEIYDKCWELKRTRKEVMIFNQFEEFGNYLWHYHVTGQAIGEVLRQKMSPKDRFAGYIAATGSAGTLAAGDYLKEKFPSSRVAAGEALQCPTLLRNGFGDHRIEGIGDKHVPWIHNVRNTDMVITEDDEACMRILRLLNEPIGQEYLVSLGFKKEDCEKLPLIGISGIGNLIAAIKFARYYELSERDFVFIICTDSMELYASRLHELTEHYGKYTREDALRDYARFVLGITTDNMLELTHYERKRIHNLKYFTWIEQQGRELKELEAQWNDYPDYWEKIRGQLKEIDSLIEEFNKHTGLL